MKFVLFVLLLVAAALQAAAQHSVVCEDVEVTVKSGRNFWGDVGGYPDPYIVVTVGHVVQRTRVIRNTRNPTWNMKMIFRHVNSAELLLQLWEKDSFLRYSDDHLGDCKTTMVNGRNSFMCRTGGKIEVDIDFNCITRYWK